MNVAIQREATVYDEPEVIARSAQELVGDLNPQQAEAVQYRGQALLIGAGAGSGKTRVLTRRIAWILSQFGAWPSQILAITFTNKAAAEMRERLGSLIGPVAQRMWVSTFHSACVRILRRDGKSIGLKSGFSIYDSADSERLVKIIATEFNLDIKRYTPRSILGHISDLKNNLTGWKENLAVHAPDFTPGQRGYQFGTVGDLEAIYAVIYAEYEHRLALANAVDFDDLIGRTVELLRTDPAVAEYYHHRFRYILVDEYQDTNHAQYVLVRELAGVDTGEKAIPGAPNAGKSGPAWITVVGDSDQSIYAFRGADIRNIQDFEQDFPNAKTIMLEQNYRSTQTILDAANAVISNNEGRKPKKLWTALGKGEPIVGYAADNAQQEAQWVATEIARLHAEEGIAYSDMAIMYRANAQSRSLEEALINTNQPYQLVGGTKFYERREIKDALAYLQALVNPDDDVNLRRILNVPKRGLGDRAEGVLLAYAREHGTSFFYALMHLDEIEVPTRTATSLRAFRDLMGALSQFTGVVDAIVTGRVDFHHVDGTWTASGEVLATGAFPAWMRGRPLGAVDAPREDTRGTGLTAATRPGKQVRMRELAAVEGPHQRNSDLILTDDPLKRVRSITSIQCKCHKLQPIATRLFPGVFPYCPHYLRTHRGLAQMVPPQRRLRTRQRQSLACRPKAAGQAGSAQADSPVR